MCVRERDSLKINVFMCLVRVRDNDREIENECLNSLDRYGKRHVDLLYIIQYFYLVVSECGWTNFFSLFKNNTRGSGFTNSFSRVRVQSIKLYLCI